ncbi:MULTISPECIES: D-aminoacylase [Mesorhizobium]|uniref:N-acyl-D-amino-acid deacylase family protein n=1 Tax=Mesorhizobium TaxID=68287 RepID=UPI000BAFD834|nr:MULTISPECIES: D-aminoacylase [Mesorhizobium]PBB58177.1 D-aminoacylase [Mesorhizobium loti]PBB83382.1 D-aminoacylase [Mesorhizobium sp. WSM3876]
MCRSFDIIIRNANIIDGTGAQRFFADVGISKDRIIAIGNLADAKGEMQIDAVGLVLAPGFIDCHTHDDRILLSAGDMTSKVSQGVTTVVGGNCGISLAPMPRPVSRPVTPPLDLLDSSGDWYCYKKFADYLNALEERPAATNCAMLVGHTTLRAVAMDDLDRTATPSEIAAMQAHVVEAMEAGAVGVSTGLAYGPAQAATTEEVIEVCRPMATYGGLYATHMRDEGDRVSESIEESFHIARELGVRLLISHHKLMGMKNHGRSVETLALIDGQMQRQDVCLDCYPYAASSTILTLNSALKSSRTIVTWSKSLPQYVGRDLHDVVEEMGCDLADAVRRLQPAGAIYFSMHEDDVQRILKYAPTMIGSDGLPHDENPHPRLWGTFPRVLGRYSRDAGLFPLETAVHKMTGLTALKFGFDHRGVIEVGAFADITLFNPDTVVDRSTFQVPIAISAGIEVVLVNGVVVWRDGQSTGTRPGRVLRSQGRTALTGSSDGR